MSIKPSIILRIIGKIMGIAEKNNVNFTSIMASTLITTSSRSTDVVRGIFEGVVNITGC